MNAAIEAAASDMELRDKVARAMVERQHMEWDQLGGGDHGYYGQLADAAIAAVQEAEADTISTLRAEVERLREGLANLERAESEYRWAHDTIGGGDIKTGRAWDLMRRCGDRARALLETNHAK